MISPYNQYFNQIFWINSRNRVDRYKRMKKRLAEKEISATRFDAILGGHLNRDHFKFQMKLRDLDNGELGCYMSHYSILKEIVAKKIPRTLILEDDAEFVGDFDPSILPDDWEMLFFGQHNYDTVDTAERKGCNAAIKENYKDNVYHAERCWLTHAYAITYECAIKALAYCEVIRISIDGQYADMQTDLKIKTYAYYPSIIIQDGSPSSLRLNL